MQAFTAPSGPGGENRPRSRVRGLTSPKPCRTLDPAATYGCVEVFVGEFSPWHWLLVAFIALILFGPKKLPELGKGLAEGIRGFKEGLKEQPPAQASNEQNKNTEAKS